MDMRHHKGFSHGLRPGESRDMNCQSCKREDAETLADYLTPEGEYDVDKHVARREQY